MLYISFHGGKKKLNNIHVYQDDGQRSSKSKLLPKKGVGPKRKELRAFQIVENKLYVVNGYKKYSQVLVYQLNKKGDYVFDKIYADRKELEGIFHPYDLTFDPKGNCYISDQDSNVVIGLRGPNQVLNVASFLAQNYTPSANFFKGTTVASSIGNLPNIDHAPPPDVACPQGLDVKLEKDKGGTSVTHSVRGVLFYENYLYVSDQPANAVKVYTMPSGDLHATIQGDNLEAPVQLLMNNSILYIGSSGNASVVSIDLSKALPSGINTPTTFIDNKIPHISGMTFDKEGNFYAAERKAKTILKFSTPKWKKETFISGLEDNPEFLLHV